MATHKNKSELHLERRNESGLYLPVSQSKQHHAGLKHETLIIPSTSQVSSFNGAMIIFDIKEKHLLIEDVALQFNVSSISGRTGDSTNYPRFVNQWE